MKNILITLSAVVLVLTACQKEPSFEDPNSIPGGGGTGGGGTTPSGLLVREVEVSGTDSNVTVYQYDAAKRLIQMDINSTAGGLSLTYKMNRNTNGIIAKTVVVSPQLIIIGIDSLVTNFFYNTATSRYTYTITTLDVGGTVFTDSTVFNYDAGGNIVSSNLYTKEDADPYVTSARTDYTYAGGNVSSQKYFTYDFMTSMYELEETTNYTYDTKVNPLKLGVEAVLLGLPQKFGNNNVAVMDYIDSLDPSQNYTHTFTLTYNSANKPSGGTMLENPGATSFNLRFYYN